MKMHFDIGIIGAGIVGKTAALALQKRGKKVALFDFKEADLKNERVYALNDNSKNLFLDLGLWDRVLNKSPFRKMLIKDMATAKELSLDSLLLTKDNLGFIVEDNALQEILSADLEEEGVHFLRNCTIANIENSAEGLVLYSAANKVCTVSLLILADGANSKAYDIFKLEKNERSYEQSAIVTTITTEKSHNNTAYQLFYPDNILAFLPLANKNTCSIVWSLEKSRAEELLELGEDEFLRHLNLAFSELGACIKATCRKSFPLYMRHTKQYVGDNWLLMGDSAHTIHPLAGMGLNLGLADLSTWLQLLETKKPESQLLKAYQRRRKYAVWNTIALMELLKHGFLNDNKLLQNLRAFGMQRVNSSSFLKRAIVKCANY